MPGCQHCRDRNQLRKEMERKTGHKHTLKSSGMSDQVTCSCGWKSQGYWDGVEFAMAEFDRHLGMPKEGLQCNL